MATVSGTRFNQSAHSIADVRALARAAPRTAETYLRRVAESLRSVEQAALAEQLETFLSQTGALAQKLSANPAALGFLFPAEQDGWGALQAARISTIGYQVGEQPNLPAVYIKGTVTADPFELTTAGGRKLSLTESSKTTQINMPRSYMAGLIGDGEIVLKGALAGC